MNRRPCIIVLVFAVLLSLSALSSIGSYQTTVRQIDQDLHHALEATLMEKGDATISTDTVRSFRCHLSTPGLRDTAYLAMEVRQTEGQAVVTAHSGKSVLSVWKMSDQRASGLFLSLALLWVLVSPWFLRHTPSCHHVLRMGGLTFSEENSRFYAEGQLVHFTPMQYQLMEMFFHAPGHTLSQTEICDRLWPRKPDARDTLYTLIRRLKPIVEELGHLRIECERGISYVLKDK